MWPHRPKRKEGSASRRRLAGTRGPDRRARASRGTTDAAWRETKAARLTTSQTELQKHNTRAPKCITGYLSDEQMEDFSRRCKMADAICNVQTQQRLTWKCTKSPCRSTAGQQKHREAGHGPALLRGNEQRGHLRRQHTRPEAPDGPESSKETHGRAAHQQPSRSRHAITAGARVGASMQAERALRCPCGKLTSPHVGHRLQPGAHAK